MARARVTSRKRIAQPRAKSDTKAVQLARAFAELGVEPTKVFETPQISHILKRLPGGVDIAIEHLRGYDHDEARKWLGTYDSMSATARRVLPFEAFCIASGITTKRMLEILTVAIFEQSDMTSSLIAAASHPSVVTATVAAARNPYGKEDRKMLHLHSGFVPVPKNQTVIIGKGGVQNNTQDNSKHLTLTSVTHPVAEIAGIERKQGRIADRFNEKLGLGSSRQPIQIERQAPEPESEEITEADVLESIPMGPEPELDLPDSPTNDWGA